MKQDEYGFETHKLIYHPERIVQWLEDPFSVYPIYVEIAPTNDCNHRCVFCGCDFLGYQRIFLDRAVLNERVNEMANLGIKSIMYAGEGEPLLHKEIAEIITHTRNSGIDVAVTTNGVPLIEKLSQKILGSLAWIKISIDAGTKKTYSEIHQCPERHFQVVLTNLETAVAIRKDKRYSCTIGAQMLLLPENFDEVIILAEQVRDIGLDYLIVKPHSQYPLSIVQKYKNLRYFSEDLDRLQAQIERINDKSDKFKVVIRKHTMKKLEIQRDYKRCLAVPFFWAYLDSRGNIWTCSAYLTNPRFFCGNIYDQSFKEIWQGELRWKNIEFIKKLDVSKCRKNCRMDEINKYLWTIKHPPEHVNFI